LRSRIFPKRIPGLPIRRNLLKSLQRTWNAEAAGATTGSGAGTATTGFMARRATIASMVMTAMTV
jgi:hypothetical protein